MPQEIVGNHPGGLIEIDRVQLERLRGMSYGEAMATARTFEDLKRIGAAHGYKPGWPFRAAPELGIPIPAPATAVR